MSDSCSKDNKYTCEDVDSSNGLEEEQEENIVNWEIVRYYGRLLHDASKSGDIKSAKEIIESELNYEKVGFVNKNYAINYFERGFSCLHHACFHGNEYICYLLIAHGANPYTRNSWNETCFEAAYAGGYPLLANTLQDKYISHFQQLPRSSTVVNGFPMTDLTRLLFSFEFDWKFEISIPKSNVRQRESIVFHAKNLEQNRTLLNPFELTIGRSKQCDVVINDLSVSNVHAKLVYCPLRGYSLIDVGSKHGTFIDSIRLPTEDTSDDVSEVCRNLLVTSTIRFGTVDCRIHSPFESTAAESDSSKHALIPLALQVIDTTATVSKRSGVEVSSRFSGPSFGLQDLILSSALTCQRIFIGRSAQCDIQLDDLSVSKMHAIITCIPSTGGYVLRDVGSKFGTLHNGTRLPVVSDMVQDGVDAAQTKDQGMSSGCLLAVGDVIQFGKVTCRVELKENETSQKQTINVDNDATRLQHEYAEAIRKKRLLESYQSQAEYKELKRKLSIQTQRTVYKAFQLSQATAESYGNSNTAIERDNDMYSQQHPILRNAKKVDGAGKELLTRLGWVEGQALGKQPGEANDIIIVQDLKKSVGLGYRR